MAEYQGYTIQQNPDNGKWEIFWQGKKQEGEFARRADARGLDRRSVPVEPLASRPTNRAIPVAVGPHSTL
jgi:hypothetical protein